MITDFQIIDNCFYSKITDDMYMELDKEQTDAITEELLLNSIPWFEFPRVNLQDYDLVNKRFNVQMTFEEVNILATYMVSEWLSRQLATIELVRMKMTGSDFKMTSQANHISKLQSLKKEYERQGFHLQRLYKRRKFINGVACSTFSSIMGNTVDHSHADGCRSDGEKWSDLPVLPEDN